MDDSIEDHLALTRRSFLARSALTLFSVGVVPGLLRRTALTDRAPFSAKRKVLITVFLRGAADGLNIVVPYAERDYYPLRPTIAVPRPGSHGQAAIDLDGFFALHPSLAPLKPLYDARELAIVHAVGSPDTTRSHFDAQDFMETATPGSKATPDGWLNRYLQRALRPDATPFRAVAIAPRMPRTFEGAAPALAIDDLASFRLAGGGSRGRPFEQGLYARRHDPVFASVVRDSFSLIHTLDRAGPGAPPRAAGGGYPDGPLGKSLSQAACLVRADVGLEVAFVEVGGWDHHVNEGGVDGQLARSLAELGTALAAFRHDLGARMRDVLLVTISEFGRTAHENGNRGTDHGRAGVMLVLGGEVRGGKVYGDWPGLRAERLFEGRDLALTTDFRTVLAEIVSRHLGFRDPATIFPGFRASPSEFRGFLS
ncbi:MAG TPA: DUF1501 domain-containing protein [Candidatus Binatia bacterium]|nr:DUF1501 domain-containing protein [Candidatus Binatia bacterium]